MQIASTLPAKVLSELLGLSVNAATRWNASARRVFWVVDNGASHAAAPQQHGSLMRFRTRR